MLLLLCSHKPEKKNKNRTLVNKTNRAAVYCPMYCVVTMSFVLNGILELDQSTS